MVHGWELAKVGGMGYGLGLELYLLSPGSRPGTWQVFRTHVQGSGRNRRSLVRIDEVSLAVTWFPREALW